MGPARISLESLTPRPGIREHYRPGTEASATNCAYAAERCPPTGIASSKMEPPESELTSLNLPPWFATKVEEMARPNPIPPGFVVKNGSNMRSWFSTDIPGPESATDINTVD